MRLDYSVSKDDYLTYLLFSLSRSPFIARKRKFIFLVTEGIFIFCGLLILLTNQGRTAAQIPGLGFLLLGALWFLVYPRYSAFLYRKRYMRFVREVFLC